MTAIVLDLAAIRIELATVCTTAGYPSWSFVPNDLEDFPCSVIGVPEELTFVRTFGGGGTVTLPISVAVSFAEPEDSQRRLDAAMSVNVTGALFNALAAHVPVAWGSIEYVAARNWRLVPYGVNGKALAADLVIKLTV